MQYVFTYSNGSLSKHDPARYSFIKDTLICINFLTEKKKKKLTTLQYVKFRKNGFIKDNETVKSLKSRITL